MIYADSSNLVL